LKKLKNQEDDSKNRTNIDAFLDFVLIAETIAGEDDEDDEDEDEEGCEVIM
jgi:hypothetical protein